jgi:transcriptional regulator with XRE-family HTH domain
LSIHNENIFSIGLNIKKLRAYAGVSLNKLTSDSGINFKTARNYEARNIVPSLNVLINISQYFQISLDFLILWDQTGYPKNLKLLNLAKKCESICQPDERNRITATARSFFPQGFNSKDIKQDIKIQLNSTFQLNFTWLREKNNISQKEMAGILNVTQGQIAHYEKKSVPSLDKMIKLSEVFNISVHALSTGEKLIFDFDDKDFGQAILLTDHFLPLEDHQILIRLMEAVLKNH